MTNFQFSTKKYLLTTLFTVVLFLSAFSYAHADIATGLVGHWSFDEGSGTQATDSSGNGNTGTLVNDPTWTTGRIGGALSFDGADDFVSMPVDVMKVTSLTASAWVKSSSMTNDSTVLSWDSGSLEPYTLYVDGNGTHTIKFFADNVEVTKTIDISNMWTLITGTYNENTNEILLYLDGTQVASGSGSGVIDYNSFGRQGLIIGDDPEFTQFSGLIDDVRIYNRALTQADITELYTTGSGSTPPPTDTTPPTQPTSLSALPISSSQITLNWNISSDNTAVTGYKIFRNNTLLTTTTTTNTSYSDTNLSPSTTYTYKVSAYDANGNNSLQSVQVSAVTQAQSISSDSWQATLESNFDIVDTFDELQNWHGITAVQGESSNPNDLPKRLDGSPSIWGRYSNWTGKPANEDWIKDNGFGKQVGTKSLKLSSTDGVSYMTTYFGDGTPNSGYSDIYIYFRMYVPRNAFPTRNVSNQSYNVDYVEGEPYIWWDSFKWLNINTGFTSATGWNYDDPVSHPNRYGDTEIWYHLYRTQPNQIRPNLQTFFYRRLEYADAGNYADKLIGVEMHFKLENLAGHSGSYQGNGIAELWIYDESGNSNLILQRTDMSFRPASGSGHLFNRIQLEGNKHVSGKLWKCGPGMDCSYVVDDFIVNNTRIGPTYYALLNEIPLPPSFPRGDLNQDGTVNSLDWSIMNSAWGTSNTKADLNNDGIVNTIDFSILNSEW